MKQYKELLQHVLDNGARRGDRTGTGTISVFGTQTRYDLREGFSLVTLKKTFFKSLVKELLWFLRGETNINTLGCGIWDQWANEDGELGPVYGAQWRAWRYTDAGRVEQGCCITDHDDVQVFYLDQIANLIKGLKENPLSRRHIVSAWNPAEVNQMALPPCHAMFQLYASEIPLEERQEVYRKTPVDLPVIGPVDGDFEVDEEDSFAELRLTWDEMFKRFDTPKYYLDLQLYQRSADLALGVPFNIASYALLLMMIAREVNMIPRFFIHTIGDAHIYENHIDGVKEMLSREPLPLPTVTIADKPMPYPGCPRDGSVLEPEDFQLVDYQHHPFIKLPVAV